jgi:hypothetical protein
VDLLEVELVRWSEFAPKDAVDIDVTARDDIEGPRNELGEECPWPWEPQQLVDAAIGQYHCNYCGAMVLAGVPHLDYSEETASDRLEHHDQPRSEPVD